MPPKQPHIPSPYRLSSEQHKSSPPLQAAAVPPSQEHLVATVEQELSSTTFRSSTILDYFCPYDDQTKLDSVHEVLKRAKWETEAGTLNTNKFPPKENKTLYDNFALLLNTIREALCLDTESSFFASLVFHGHDKPMYDGIKSSYPPKPDAIALLRSIEQCSGMNALLALLSVLDLEDVGDRENWDNGFTATRSKGASEKKGGDLEEPGEGRGDGTRRQRR